MPLIMNDRSGAYRSRGSARQLIANAIEHAYPTPFGLKIAGTIQVFTWERDAQRIFAKYARKDAIRMVNVGYGLGFAHQLFDAMPRLTLHLIECNLSIMRTARIKSQNRSTQFHQGSWETCLPALLDANTTVFFDAYPDNPRFRYTASDFAEYLAPLFKLLATNTYSKCFFVAAEFHPSAFRPISPIKVSRVISFPVARPLGSSRRSRISLYEAKNSRPIAI
jgi:hypothetical protein